MTLDYNFLLRRGGLMGQLERMALLLLYLRKGDKSDSECQRLDT